MVCMSEKLILVHVLKIVKKMDLNRSDHSCALMLTCRNSPLWQRCECCKPTLGRAMMVSRPFQNHCLKQKLILLPFLHNYGLERQE